MRCKEIDDRDDELVYRHEVWRMEHELKETQITNPSPLSFSSHRLNHEK